MPHAVAVDIGGTFTDLVAYDHEARRVVYAKSPTTYHNFVDGILDCFGKVKLSALAEKLKTLDIEAVAIFFMNSYANPQHEETAAVLLRKHLPRVYVTYSTQVTREWYEYERTSTAAANAYVGPQVTRYIRGLE